jgi:hypothetical protein
MHTGPDDVPATQSGGDWQLVDGHAVSTRCKTHRIYIRALIDIGSHEFVSSGLKPSAKLEIIESIGVEAILSAMAEIAGGKGRLYRPEIEGRSDIELLRLLSLR